MLLGNDLLAARIWNHRERIEWEAAEQFAVQAQSLRSLGAPSQLIDMTTQAARDEIDHAGRCRSIVEKLAPGLEPEVPRTGVVLGPRSLTVAERALYTSVALSCITETLSTALLIEMRSQSKHPLVRGTVSKILKDEVRHARIGWAHLAWQAEQGDVSWLGPHIEAMIASAIADGSEVSDRAVGLEGMGILGASCSARLVEETMDQTVLPGLAHFGVVVARGRRAA